MQLIYNRINAFVELGNHLRNFLYPTGNLKFNPSNALLEEAVNKASIANSWYVRDNILYALDSWQEILREDSLNQWLKRYEPTLGASKNVAVIMAGNIPLVGFHDFISVLLTGHRVICKMSSNDPFLLPALATILINIDPSLATYIFFEKNQLKDFDAVIATGSNNTFRYFEYYFRDKPKILRKNRNSVALLTGNETKKQLEELGEDIFRYFGLGCRNVTKLYVPKAYDFATFFEAILPWSKTIEHHKYANNYDYNKAVYLMSNANLLDNEFLLLKEDTQIASPIGCLFFEQYQSLKTVIQNLSENHEQLQCIVNTEVDDEFVPFGMTQKPQLWDYADGVDTVSFLFSLT